MEKKNYLLKMMEEEENQFRRVRNYIMDNFDRKFTIDEIAKETGISRKLISKWLNEGKLTLGKPSSNSKDDFLTELIKTRDEMIKKLEKKK